MWSAVRWYLHQTSKNSLSVRGRALLGIATGWPSVALSGVSGQTKYTCSRSWRRTAGRLAGNASMEEQAWGGAAEVTAKPPCPDDCSARSGAGAQVPRTLTIQR